MNRTHPRSSHHAILVGVNWYQRQPLRGAVQDVLDAQAHLVKALPSIRLHTFTATASDNPDFPGPTEDTQYLPTIGNICNAFFQVKEEAKPRDCVYIHFSCHGTVIEEVNGSSLGLVLIGHRQQETYLRGLTLASMINDLVNENLTVTLVLDCCFSGHVHRGRTIRYLPYDTNIAAANQSDILQHQTTSERGLRDTDIMNHFVIKNTDRYAIIAAAAHDQEAAEVQLPGSEKYFGQLSRLLLDTLKDPSDLGRSMQDIYSRVCFGFRHNALKQHPILYGNERLPFFDVYMLTRSSESHHDSCYYDVDINGMADLSIRAGRAHGISDGDEFTLYPSTSPGTVPQSDPIVARVSQAGNFRSAIEPVGALVDGFNGWDWSAIVRSQSALKKFPIKLSSTLPDNDEWLAELQKRSLEAFVRSDHRDFSFFVDLEADQFIFQDSNEREVPNIPVLHKSQSNIREMSDLLEHLVRFHTVMDLHNPDVSAEFEKSFEAEMLVNGRPVDPTQVISIKHRGRVEIKIRNKGLHSIYVSIYNLSPQWGVINALKEAYTKIGPQSGDAPNSVRKAFIMKIPDGMLTDGHTSCRDIVKIFVTSHPSLMYNLQLPRMNKYPSVKETRTRHTPPSDVEEDWTVSSFQFHTTL